MRNYVKPYQGILILICLMPDISHAATEYATFESFYKASPYIGWAIAAVIAIATGAFIFFTGGTASPIVATIGTWLGGMMGLSGIAATNAGLAMLGGGSIASGGFGIVGGTALLTAALSYGTDVVFDYTVGKAVSEYQYSNLAEQSKEMPTLPLPENSSGPNAYENAIEKLDGIDEESLFYSNNNQKIISRAIKILEADKEELDPEAKSKNETLLSLLYFVSNNYLMAKEYADIAIMHARYSGVGRTLPEFIYATSTLYEEEFDFKAVTKKHFSYSILEEPDNPLIPLLFSLYLDRMQLRFNDDYLDESTLMHVFNIMKSPLLEELRVQNYVILISRYFMYLKLEQQTILSIVNTPNDAIRESVNTLMTVEGSLIKYKQLVVDANHVMTNIIPLELDEESRIKVAELHGLLVEYTLDVMMLASHVDQLRRYQDDLSENVPVLTDDEELDRGKWSVYVILVVLIITGLFVAKGTNKKVLQRKE